jgi:hypothetical protein
MQVGFLEFTNRVVSETAYGVVADYGERRSTMTLFALKGQYLIEWLVFDERGEVIDGADIGIWAEHRKVVDYDGVFELTKEAIQLLQSAGFDTTEVSE